jgi:RNA recognition motif 2
VIQGCNVGYAFVNFITVQDLLLFAKSKLGLKWSVICFSVGLELTRDIIFLIGICIPVKKFYR